MAFAGRRVTVDTTAGGTILITGADAGSDEYSDMPSAMVKNTHASTTIYLGASGVTSSTGYPLAAGESIPIGGIGSGDVLYAISGTGSVTVALLEVS